MPERSRTPHARAQRPIGVSKRVKSGAAMAHGIVAPVVPDMLLATQQHEQHQ